MNQELKVINPLEYSDWNELLISNPEYSFFHSSNWAAVLHESYGYMPRYFTEIKQDRISLLIPFMEIKSFLTGRRGVSLPFSDYCEPIIPKEAEYGEILARVIEDGKDSKWKSLEFRGGDQGLLKDQIPYSTWFGHSLTLDRDEEKLFSLLSGNTRRNIKKAQREGVTVKIESTLESLNEYYRLHCLTRKRHGLPVQPWHFFEKIHKHIFLKNQGFVALASHQDRVIAGAVYFHLGEKAIYKYGASDKEYQHLRANDLVMWEAIKWFSRNGYKSFSFGRTEQENSGLVQFKAGWGSVETKINYYKYIVDEMIFLGNHKKSDAPLNYVLRNAPVSFLRLIGAFLYKHVG